MEANSNFVLAEYIWIDADMDVRGKTMVIHKPSVTLKDLPHWNYDGSSTNQAQGHDSEVIIKPRALFHDPFRGKNHVIVLCDTYGPSGKPLPTNTRAKALELFDRKRSEEPWFGIEQEYTIFQDGAPLGFPRGKATSGLGPCYNFGYPAPQLPYYCSVGADRNFGRDLAEMHLDHCLRAGIQVSGINAEVMCGQYEYQVGPCVGIASGDQVFVSRYLLHRCAEVLGYVVSLHPKPIRGDWNGAGAHCNFSTKRMREEENAFEKVMRPMFSRLEKRHKEHMRAYGEHNEQRLTGKHETASIESFGWGVADRGKSIRVGNETAQSGKGYFEDRRPASNCDPYLVTSMLFETCCLME